MASWHYLVVSSLFLCPFLLLFFCFHERDAKVACTLMVLEQPSKSAIVGQNTMARASPTGRGLDSLLVQQYNCSTLLEGGCDGG